MIDKLPMTLLAQLDDVAVFQTSAFQVSDLVNTDAKSIDTEFINAETANFDMAENTNQHMCQSGQASYGELNLGLHVNDDATQVLTNRMRLLAAINQQLSEQQATQQYLPIQSLHWVNQVHGKQVYDVDSMPLSMQPVDADAMISQQSNLGLAIMTADCVPIVLYQPATGQIAAIHAGWQGLACGVIKATTEHFSETGQIVAWIGVCISQAHYEVGNHVRDQLLAGCIKNQLLTASSIDSFNKLYCISTKPDPECLHNTVDKPANHATVGSDKIATDKININLAKLANDQLIAAGIKVGTDLSVDCSYGNANYYSYRRQTHLQQPATGRMALIIVRSSSVNGI